ALGSLLAYVNRRRALAAALLFLALLGKEAVVLAPVAAVALDDARDGWRARLRRAWPLALAVAIWLALALWATTTRGTRGAGFSLTAIGPVVAPLLLLRVVLGLEWLAGELPFSQPTAPGLASLLAVLLAAAAMWLVAPRIE